MNLPQIQRILQEFEKQSDVMDMKEEIMNDAIDEAMGDEADEEERYTDCIRFNFVMKMFSDLLIAIFSLQRSNRISSTGRTGFTIERSIIWFKSSIRFVICYQ